MGICVYWLIILIRHGQPFSSSCPVTDGEILPHPRSFVLPLFALRTSSDFASLVFLARLLLQSTFAVWVKLADMVGGKGHYSRVFLDVSSFGDDVVRAFLPRQPVMLRTMTHLHLVTMAGEPTLEEERAALMQPSLNVRTELGVEYNGSSFLVAPPEAKGA